MIEQQHKSSVLSTRNKFFILLISLFTVFFLWMCIAKVDITTQAVGVVAPEKNITQLGTMVTGEIVAVNYKQGDVVKKGDIINFSYTNLTLPTMCVVFMSVVAG